MLQAAVRDRLAKIQNSCWLGIRPDLMPWRVLGEATFLVVAEPAPPEWLLAKLVEREAATLPVLGLLLAI